MGCSSACCFLLAAGLTLVFGIMSFVNLAHGSLYMLGAYFGAAFCAHRIVRTGLIAAVVGAWGLVGLLLDRFCADEALRARSPRPGAGDLG